MVIVVAILGYDLLVPLPHIILCVVNPVDSMVAPPWFHPVFLPVALHGTLPRCPSSLILAGKTVVAGAAVVLVH